MENIRYTPLTAAPWKRSKEYQEILPKSRELAKYIRCFWGSESPYWKRENPVSSLVIPDTCADIIYYMDYTDNTVYSIFCGINDSSFQDADYFGHGHLVSVFAVRFYAWGVYAFSEDSLDGTLNRFYDVRSRFHWLDLELRQQLFEKSSLKEKIETAETLFLQKLLQVRHNSDVDRAVEQMILQKGTQTTAQLAKECFISSRQLERLFHKYIGITPKKLGNLVRYQFLWNDILRNRKYSIMDAVVKYGFTDQSHLMREFKRYHAMDIQTAKRHAFDDVGNIQYFSARSE